MDFKYPYTDFHELNLDWFLAEFKKLTAEWLQVQHDWEDEQQAFQDLHDYVQDYFANLNLYQEVHDVLYSDEMQQTIQIMLSNISTSQLPAVVADQIASVVASQLAPVVAAQLPNLLNSMLPSFLPDAVAGETSEWLAAHVDPATGYVIDDTLTISQAAADAKTVGDKLDIIYDNTGIIEPTLSLVAGSFVSATDDSIQSSSQFSMTLPIKVKKGNVVQLTAKGYVNVGVIATCNSDNTSRKSVCRSFDTTEATYTYIVENDGYIVASFNHASTYSLKIFIDYHKMLDCFEELQPMNAGTYPCNLYYIDAAYINASGTYVSDANFYLSNSIKLLKGQKLSLTAIGYNTNVAMISLYDGNTYTPVVISIDSSEHVYEYTATENCVVRCSFTYRSHYTATITSPETALVRIDEIENTLNDYTVNDIKYPIMFDNVLCIGDSLTVGYDGSGDTPLVKNYPHFLRKLLDCTTVSKAHGGWTTKQIWDGEISTATDLANYDCAIIFLGTNGGLTDTVSADCKADYTLNTDNNTGCYGKIIGRIKEVNPSCKIFCVAGVNDYIRRATTMNPAVRSLAAFYNVELIDVENCLMSDDGNGSSPERYLYRPIDGIHYNALGYLTLANLFNDRIRSAMAENLSDYA